MKKPLPNSPSLDHLRKQAKDLLRSLRLGDPAAQNRFGAVLPSREALALSDAQFVVAKEYGFDSWPKLVLAVEEILAAKGPTQETADAFVRSAVTDAQARLGRLLDLYPSLPDFNVETALVCGNPGKVSEALKTDRGFATAKLGLNGWTPLEYVCYSRAFRIRPKAYVGLEGCCRALLDAGADPNSSHLWSEDDLSPLSALYGAAGETGHLGIVRLLLESGANPNDEESMYHAAQHNWREILELLVEHGGDVNASGSKWTNTPVYFLCGWRPTDQGYDEVLAGIEWLLEHGADPNWPCYNKSKTAIQQACRTDGTKLVDMLLRFGADPSVRDSEGRDAYEIALLSGNEYAARAIERAGFGGPIDASVSFLAACAQGDEKEVARMLKGNPKILPEVKNQFPEVLRRLAEFGKSDGVRELIRLGVDVSAVDSIGATPLHYACFTAQAEVVRILLRAGARIDIEDTTYHSTPLGWALHSLGWSFRADADYRSIIKDLLNAGASREQAEKFLECNQEDMPQVRLLEGALSNLPHVP